MNRSSLLILALLSTFVFACGGPEKGPEDPGTNKTPSGNNVSDSTPTPTDSKAGDRDGDGVPDASDECPEIAESKNGIDDSDGCPEVDIDRDGIVGSADKCPSDPEDKDGYEDDDGCPDVDGDKDGVADLNDMCPTEAETINAYKDSDGCADVVPPSVKEFLGTIDKIAFGSGSSRLLASSKPTLKKAAKVFIEYPEARIEIQGHTDNEGDRDANVELSQKRADAVRAYLIKRGVKPAQLAAKGYGPDSPKGNNSTKAGRAQNRRVDFKLISDAP